MFSKKIKIGKETYTYKDSPIRSLFYYEEMNGKGSSAKIEGVEDRVKYYYCKLRASNNEFLSYDEFVDILEEDPEIFTKIIGFEKK